MNRLALPAFSAYGIELEYMIVDLHTLDIMPLAQLLLCDTAKDKVSEVPRGILAWSNELVAHLIEIKNPTPLALESLVGPFQREVQELNRALAEHGACLLPTGMHPWMNPRKETRIWPHDNLIYETYHRIFDCRQHGWANLQSMHINLPFADDHEFARLHAAIRVVLPIIPAIAASSPFADGAPTGFMDFRMETYGQNAKIIPSIAGATVPETVTSRVEHESQILKPMYKDIASYDEAGVLQYEWLNSRAAIPRFDRDAIEIRIVDMQECPRADLAIAATVIALVRLIYEGEFISFREQQGMSTQDLANILWACVKDAEQAEIVHDNYLGMFGLPKYSCEAKSLWTHLWEMLKKHNPAYLAPWCETIEFILSEGSLASRILRAVGHHASRSRLQMVYTRLARCLQAGICFQADAA
mgnify:CR=1 FL=1